MYSLLCAVCSAVEGMECMESRGIGIMWLVNSAHLEEGLDHAAGHEGLKLCLVAVQVVKGLGKE